MNNNSDSPERYRVARPIPFVALEDCRTTVCRNCKQRDTRNRGKHDGTSFGDSGRSSSVRRENYAGPPELPPLPVSGSQKNQPRFPLCPRTTSKPSSLHNIAEASPRASRATIMATHGGGVAAAQL